MSLLKLRKKPLSPANQLLILNYLLEEVGALPFQDLITYNEQNTMCIAGKPITMEQAQALKTGADSLEKNFAYRTIKEQLAFQAIKFGVHSSVTLDMLILGKAALWIQEREKEWIDKLSGK